MFIRKLLRLRLSETQLFQSCRDREQLRLENFQVVETETHRDSKIQGLSRPRLIETGQKLSRPRLWRESRYSLSYWKEVTSIDYTYYNNSCQKFCLILFEPKSQVFHEISTLLWTPTQIWVTTLWTPYTNIWAKTC